MVVAGLRQLDRFRAFNRCFRISADGAFLMLGAFPGCLLVDYPLKRMRGLVQLLSALTGVPMAGFIEMPAAAIGSMPCQLRCHRICQGDLLRAAFVAESLIAAVAVPVFDVAFFPYGLPVSPLFSPGLCGWKR